MNYPETSFELASKYAYEFAQYKGIPTFLKLSGAGDLLVQCGSVLTTENCLSQSRQTSACDLDSQNDD